MKRTAKTDESGQDTWAATLPRDHARHWRWWGAAAGLLVGLFDAVAMAALGVTFEMNGRSATTLVGVYFGLSFAALGFLLGAIAAARRHDRHAAAVIQRQTEAIAATRARLLQSEKLAALGQLAAAIAHEVRNPLGIMRSAAQGIGESVPATDQRTQQACSFIVAEIDRLTNVVTSLLGFARPPQLAARRVAVRDVLDRAVLLAGDDLQEKQVRLQRSDAQDLPAVHADADLLCQVLLGLLANATEAVPAGSTVTVETRVEAGGVEIAVADCGSGVPVELRGQIFDPFFTTRARGTGLGLAIARQIIEAHGGRIHVADRAGGGARFCIYLPAAPAAALAA